MTNYLSLTMDELLSWVNIYENNPQVTNLQENSDKAEEEDYAEVFKAFVTDMNANELVKPPSSEEEPDQEDNLSDSNKCARIKQRRNGVYMPRDDLKMKNLMEEIGSSKWENDAAKLADSTNTNNKETKPSASTSSSVEELLLLLNGEDTDEQMLDFPMQDSDHFDQELSLQYFATH